jgi:hypothetical protein
VRSFGILYWCKTQSTSSNWLPYSPKPRQSQYVSLHVVRSSVLCNATDWIAGNLTTNGLTRRGSQADGPSWYRDTYFFYFGTHMRCRSDLTHLMPFCYSSRTELECTRRQGTQTIPLLQVVRNKIQFTTRTYNMASIRYYLCLYMISWVQCIAVC